MAGRASRVRAAAFGIGRPRAKASPGRGCGDGDSAHRPPMSPTCAALHAYTAAGSYKACLVVTDDLRGQSNRECQTVTITPNKAPVANFDAKQTATPAFTMAFTDLSKD